MLSTGARREHKRGHRDDNDPARATIFVRLAAYRDAECEATVEDAFAKAEHPERVFFGICWQFEPGTDPAVPARARQDQVRFVRVPARDTRGVCWARYQAEQLWRGEDYSLQVDSHSRFVPGWDVRLIKELARCDSPKPLLSTSPASYQPPDLLDENPLLYVRSAAKFNDDGTIRFGSHPLGNAPAEPVRGAFVAAGFVFSRSELLREVPYDPYLYFSQEETAYSMRVFTHGWDLFCPTQVFIYHYYNVAGPQGASVRPLHWSDQSAWWRLDQLGRERYQHLTGARLSTELPVTAEIDRFGLGRARTLGQYEAYAGIEFRRRVVLERASRGEVTAPIPLTTDVDTNASKLRTGLAALTPKDVRPPVTSASSEHEAPLRQGAFVPALSLLDVAGKAHAIRSVAGAPTALFVLPAAELGSFKRFFADLARHEEELRGLQRVYVTPLPVSRLRLVERRLGLFGSIWADPERRVSRLLGATCAGSTKVALTTCLLGPDLRLIEAWRTGTVGEQIRQLTTVAASLLDAPSTIPIPRHAPVLIVPGVLSPDEVLYLISRLDSDRDSIAEQQTHEDRWRTIDRALGQTLFPEISRVFGGELVRRERYTLGRHVLGETSASDDEYTAVPATDCHASRRFSVTINLSDDYHGGEILFPEYGPVLYRPPCGTAIVSPCSILRRYRPVTSGSRPTLTFFVSDNST